MNTLSDHDILLAMRVCLHSLPIRDVTDME